MLWYIEATAKSFYNLYRSVILKNYANAFLYCYTLYRFWYVLILYLYSSQAFVLASSVLFDFAFWYREWHFEDDKICRTTLRIVVVLIIYHALVRLRVCYFYSIRQCQRDLSFKLTLPSYSLCSQDSMLWPLMSLKDYNSSYCCILLPAKYWLIVIESDNARNMKILFLYYSAYAGHEGGRK